MKFLNLCKTMIWAGLISFTPIWPSDIYFTMVDGLSHAIHNGFVSLDPLFGKLLFSFFCYYSFVSIYFIKGIIGRNNRTPTIVLVWSILIATSALPIETRVLVFSKFHLL